MQISCRHFPRQKKKKALTVIVKYHVQLQVNNSEAMGHFATLGFSNGEQMCRKHKWQHLCRRVWYSDPKKTCACAYLFYFCALGEFQLFPEKAVTATTPCIQSFKWKFLHASVDKDFICIRLGQKNLRWKEGMCFRRYKVLVKHTLNIVWLESIIGASSAEGWSGVSSKRGWRWNHITSCLLLFSLLMERRAQLDEKLQQSSNTFIFKPLPAGEVTQNSTEHHLSVWVSCSGICGCFPCVNKLSYAQKRRYPAETVTSNVTPPNLNVGCKGKFSVWRDLFGELTLSSWLLYYPGTQRILEGGEGYLLVQFLVLGAHFIRNRLLPSAMAGSHFAGGSFAISEECALFKGTNLCWAVSLGSVRVIQE